MHNNPLMHPERPRVHRDNVPAARQLRRKMTKSEEVLWSHIRGRQFHGMKFRRQHPVGQFVLDFYCNDLLIAIEIDGGIHLEPSVAAADAERQALLEELHIHFYRWRANDVERDCARLLANLAIELQFVQAPLLPGLGEGVGG